MVELDVDSGGLLEFDCDRAGLEELSVADGGRFGGVLNVELGESEVSGFVTGSPGGAV